MRWALLALVACSQPAPKPPEPAPAPEPTTTTTPDAREADEQERLAAIQKAMNELDEAAQGCWAAAATERFDIAGELTVMVEIQAASAQAKIVADTAKNAKLADCVAKLLSAYRWAPPLHGQTIQLPFKFKAPDGQSVIDRRLVESRRQGSVSVAVLLDETNTGNGDASMFELGIAPRASTGMRLADRAELWYFLGEVEVKSAIKGSRPDSQGNVRARLKAGDMMYVPKGAAREVIAAVPEFRAVVVVVPGGREGAARAGALPTTTQATGTALAKPLMAGIAGKKFGPATIFLEPSVVKDTPLAASILELPAGAKVAEHVHAKETEMLYVLEGSGTMTIAGTEVAVQPTSVIQIPKNTKHAFTATAAVRALQIYTPAGPEQRFKKQP